MAELAERLATLPQVRAACDDLADALAAELATMAQWLELTAIEVGGRGDLASPLRRAVGHYAQGQ